MRKALVLTRNFPPQVTSGASRVWKLASNLVSIGWEPIVVAPPSVVATMAATPSPGANPVIQVHRTGPDIDASKLEADDRSALLHGRPVAALRSLSSRLATLFRAHNDGDLWAKSAAAMVERLLAEQPDIDLLYAQGPPIEPLTLALETAKKHHLTVVLDITSPLDASMPAPGTTASSAEAKAEECILLSGVPMITPTRALKEYFLKKYRGRLDHGAMTIVPNAFDGSHTASRKQGSKLPELTLRVALLMDEVPKQDLKALFSGIEAWARADGLRSGDVELTLFGEGAAAAARSLSRSPIKPFLAVDAAGSITDQLDHCRKADFFCAMLGRSPVNTCTIPERLVDALGMGLPLAAILPDGVAAKLVVEAGGMTAQAGDPASIAELFRSMASAWRARTLQGAPRALAERYAIGTVIHEFTKAIANQYVR
ncbi:MAG: glycosyltransferase family 4 protein [Chlorobiaceae bacterium]|nr:glycosyltransferase family 4 protein [Chlorobiaceae bacterium]